MVVRVDGCLSMVVLLMAVRQPRLGASTRILVSFFLEHDLSTVYLPFRTFIRKKHSNFGFSGTLNRYPTTLVLHHVAIAMHLQVGCIFQFSV